LTPERRLTTSSHVIHDCHGVSPPAQFVEVPPRIAKDSRTYGGVLLSTARVSTTSFVLPPNAVGLYSNVGPVTTFCSPPCSRFS
jgi:hypothetical protein